MEFVSAAGTYPQAPYRDSAVINFCQSPIIFIAFSALKSGPAEHAINSAYALPPPALSDDDSIDISFEQLAINKAPITLANTSLFLFNIFFSSVNVYYDST